MLQVHFIVGSEGVTLERPPSTTLAEAATAALEAMQHTGAAGVDWRAVFADGRELDPSGTLGAQLSDGATVYLEPVAAEASPTP